MMAAFALSCVFIHFLLVPFFKCAQVCACALITENSSEEEKKNCHFGLRAIFLISAQSLKRNLLACIINFVPGMCARASVSMSVCVSVCNKLQCEWKYVADLC